MDGEASFRHARFVYIEFQKNLTFTVANGQKRPRTRKVYAMFSPGPVQMMIVLLIALLLFGNRLPSVMRSLGRSITEFKKGVNDVDHEVRGALKDADEKAKKSDSSEE